MVESGFGWLGIGIGQDDGTERQELNPCKKINFFLEVKIIVLSVKVKGREDPEQGRYEVMFEGGEAVNELGCIVDLF